MTTDADKQQKTGTDALVPSTRNIDNDSSTVIQASIRRFEIFLFVILIIHGALVLLVNNNPPLLYGIICVLGLNLLGALLDKSNNQAYRLLRGIITVGLAGMINVFAIDPLHMLLASFFIISVYYSFVLVPPHYYVILFTLVFAFTVTYLAIPQSMDGLEYVIRLSLMIVLSGLMRYLRQLVDVSVNDRQQLMDDLRQVQIGMANQLEERTAELQKEIREREQAQNRLMEERQLLQTIINTFPSRLFVKDRESRFTLVNRWSLERMGLQDDPQAVVGKSDFDFYPHFAERTYADEQQIMTTGEPTIDWEEMTIDDEGNERHYLISKVPMYHPQTNEIMGLVGVTTEITTLKSAQIALRESEESLKQFQLRLKALNRITIHLTRIESFHELMYQSVRQGIDHLGFTQLSCRLIDVDNPTHLVGGCQVNQDGEIIMTKYDTIKVPDDHPIIQIVSGNKTNHVVRDTLVYDEEWNAIGRGDKAFSAILNRDKIIGFLYTDNLFDNEPISESQFELLNLYGATLGALFNRQQTQEALKMSEEEALSFQQRLKQLNEITITLESMTSLDELCRQTVILGREKLGFDRLGIWFIDKNDPTMRRGMWGTDRYGNLRDERQEFTPLTDQEYTMITEGDIMAMEGSDIFDLDGEFIRKGWNLIGLMWDGSRRIGWIYADNGLNGHPLTPNQHELFRLYAATIGLLVVRQIADEQLRQSEIRYRAITEASSDIIIIVDRESIVTYISPSIKIVMGVDPRTITGRPIVQLIHRDDVAEATELFHKCLQTPRLNLLMNEFRARHADGHWIHMEAVITSMVDDPVISGILVSCRDLTQRKIADERKRIVDRERERASVLRQFLSDISHDFRTPLSTIATNAYLLEKGKAEQREKRIDGINQQIERLSNLLDNMNMITKLEETSQVKMEKININQLLESIPFNRSQVLDDKQLKLTLDLQENLPMLIGNISLLHDAVYHLVDNAIQFCRPSDSIHLQSYDDQNQVVINIEDTGGGIAEEDIPFIFDRLYRADKARNSHTGGSGLGLAITRRIVDLHHGNITATSQLDQGTTIQIRLPYNVNDVDKNFGEMINN